VRVHPDMIRGDNIVLTSVHARDLPVLLRWINDREQVLFSASYRPISDGQHARWFETLQQRSDVVMFAIRRRSQGPAVGSCQLHSIDPVHRSAELQIRIGNVGARGHGHGTEAVKLLVRFAFRDLNLHRVFVRVLATNQRALRVYEKAGFRREGLLRDAAHVDGRYVDVVVLGVVRR
jgi:RimJ/RimL family protein N-acetyltransferase